MTEGIVIVKICSETDIADCRMTLRLSGIVGETSDKDTVTQDERYELTITWSNPKITKGAEGKV